MALNTTSKIFFKHIHRDGDSTTSLGRQFHYFISFNKIIFPSIQFIFLLLISCFMGKILLQENPPAAARGTARSRMEPEGSQCLGMAACSPSYDRNIPQTDETRELCCLSPSLASFLADLELEIFHPLARGLSDGRQQCVE